MHYHLIFALSIILLTADAIAAPLSISDPISAVGQVKNGGGPIAIYTPPNVGIIPHLVNPVVGPY
ncbi:hypothetical protein DFP72DRAFT_1062722 [Ephemerocybe angulata]|uniref:Uncharacterized protein n=1 Tax=Ephemerocybe angulata TaxID=980116 RepID=A0A8H6IAQ3_9AGAR|nr:hypothetical protein DFP72DRAFT_1062722 [Tulosesus angulatus]